MGTGKALQTGFILLILFGWSQGLCANDHDTQRHRHHAWLQLIQHFEDRGFDQPDTRMLIERQMNTGGETAQRLLSYASKSLQQLREKNRSIAQQMLCPKGLNISMVSENAEMLVSTIDEIQDSNLYTLYSSTLSEFDKNTFNQLNLWLDKIQERRAVSASIHNLEEHLGACKQHLALISP